MNNIAVISTFPNNMFDVYGKKMLESFSKYWPKDIPLMIQLDDDLLADQIDKMVPAEYGIFSGQSSEHKAFVERNKDKDSPTDYRKQAVRFCHKVFAIHKVYEAVTNAKAANAKDVPRYIIWLDADVITTRAVTIEEIRACLPKEGDSVSYLGRKDWDHSECGWLAFDLENGADRIIKGVYECYTEDKVFKEDQWHDSWIWDLWLNDKAVSYKATNLTKDKPGVDIWLQSPMAAWSTHYKGPVAKQQLFQKEQIVRPPNGQNFVIQTKNAIPAEEICKHIETNQLLIKDWVSECLPTDETIVVASAGPMMFPEDIEGEIKKGRKVVAVKHALKRLKESGIKPWACILLDPRPHVLDFVTEADPETIWFVASQVNPAVTKALLDKGCKVWGYHASVGAGEETLTIKQPSSVIHGGSATATRGLYLLYHLGFRNYNLYGYELSFPDKPDLNARDESGQPKFMEFSLTAKDAYINYKKSFYSEPQLIAQYEELSEMIKIGKFNIKAHGDGMIPFMLRCKELTDLRKAKNSATIPKTSYRQLLWKETKSSPIWRRILPKTLRKQTVSIK